VEAALAFKGLRLFQNFAARSPRERHHYDLNPLMLGQVANDFCIHPGDRLEFSRPVAVIVRPSQPCGGVRLPLGRHSNCLLMEYKVLLEVSPGGAFMEALNQSTDL